jgi:hypothetical protein
LLPLAVAWTSCSFDTTREAPHVDAPTAEGPCGTTATLLPKLLEFVKEDRFAPLRTLIEDRFLPTADNPNPDPSLRTMVEAAVRLVSDIGLSRTQLVVLLLEKGSVESQIGPLISTVLKFLDGRLDATQHYDAGDSAAVFLRTCNPDHLLTAAEGVVRLQSPSHDGERWLLAVLRELQPLVDDSELLPFLTTFEENSSKGKPAIISILTQIMILVADPAFTIDRVQTFLESAVYPSVSEEFAQKIKTLTVLLQEATAEEAGVLSPLQDALRCGLAHPKDKDALLGLIYDLLATPAVGFDRVVAAVNSAIQPDVAEAELDLVADTLHAMRTDLTIRDDLREIVAILLSQPNVQLTVPVAIELVDRGVVSEIMSAIAKLLSGCGRTETTPGMNPSP